MSKTSNAPVVVDPAGDDVADGWQLGRESWSFHRQFYLRVGRPALFREYAYILWQIRRGTCERPGPDLARVTLAGDVAVIVRFGFRAGKRVLLGALPSSWMPLEEVSPEAPSEPSRAVVAPKPIDAPPAPTPPVRGSTLTLRSPAAATALAGRLHRLGITGAASHGIRA